MTDKERFVETAKRTRATILENSENILKVLAPTGMITIYYFKNGNFVNYETHR